VNKNKALFLRIHLKLYKRLFVGDTENELKNLINQQGTFGLLISIDNQTTTPLIDSNMMRLKSGTCTYINLRKTYSKDVPTPYSDCTSLDIFNSIYNSQFVNYNLSVS
jgi:hypothetical protein